MQDRFSARGIDFVLQELPIDAYDELTEKHTKRDEESGDETFDTNAFLRDLTLKSLKEPLWAQVPKGTRLIRMLEQRARDLHIGEEPVVVEKTGNTEETEEEGTPPAA